MENVYTQYQFVLPKQALQYKIQEKEGRKKWKRKKQKRKLHQW